MGRLAEYYTVGATAHGRRTRGSGTSFHVGHNAQASGGRPVLASAVTPLGSSRFSRKTPAKPDSGRWHSACKTRSRCTCKSLEAARKAPLLQT